MKNEYCYYQNVDGERVKGEFVGIFQHSHTHGDSALVGGFKAGTIAYPVAVVITEKGKIIELNVGQVEVIK